MVELEEKENLLLSEQKRRAVLESKLSVSTTATNTV